MKAELVAEQADYQSNQQDAQGGMLAVAHGDNVAQIKSTDDRDFFNGLLSAEKSQVPSRVIRVRQGRTLPGNCVWRVVIPRFANTLVHISTIRSRTLPPVPHRPV